MAVPGRASLDVVGEGEDPDAEDVGAGVVSIAAEGEGGGALGGDVGWGHGGAIRCWRGEGGAR